MNKKAAFSPEKIDNPYYGWEGQGYWGDMEIRENKKKDAKYNGRKKWAMASQYFHLQNQCKVSDLLVQEFIAYDKNGLDVTTYLMDDLGIEKYFNKNPNNLPDFEDGDYSAIPRVHIPQNRKK